MVDGPNISMKEAQTRLRDKKCLNCGQPRTNVELDSCNRELCRKVLRPLYHWTQRVAHHFDPTDSTTSYIA